MKKSITILHLYPQEMSIYGDLGNILTLTKRLEWRGCEAKVEHLGVGGSFDIAQADIIFGGGGQDRGQITVGADLLRHADDLHTAAGKGVPILTICGTYQLFGHGFTTLEGQEIPGISIFNARTVGSTQRMIGNVIMDSPFGELVGFENHSGRTVLESSQQPLGRLVQGYGNDGSSGYEGSVTGSAYGTYLHGPLLPKNPAFADALILQALGIKFGVETLPALDDSVELSAVKLAKARPQ